MSAEFIARRVILRRHNSVVRSDFRAQHHLKEAVPQQPFGEKQGTW